MHHSVLTNEAVEFLNINPHGTYLDATFGGGGHAGSILKKLSLKGKLLLADCNAAAISRAGNVFAGNPQCLIYRARFSEIATLFKKENLGPVDGVLADLGISSFQLDEEELGLTFQKRQPLDMRLDDRLDSTAADLVNGLPEEELANIFYEYGEERYSRRLARAIVFTRREKKFSQTDDLCQLILRVLGPVYRQQKIHPATRVFQALRIAVNEELKELEGLLDLLPVLLAPGGRAVILSFHSLEDRRVKQKFRELARQDWKIVTKKPVVPTPAEVAVNRRSRSVKMRVIEKQSTVDRLQPTEKK